LLEWIEPNVDFSRRAPYSLRRPKKSRLKLASR
jgi:hypothetical protein